MGFSRTLGGPSEIFLGVTIPGVFEGGILGAIYSGAGVRAIGLEVLGIANSAFFTGGLDTGVSAPSESDYESMPIEAGLFIGLGVGFLAGAGCGTAPIAPF